VELELKTTLEMYRNTRSQNEKARLKKRATDLLRRKKMYTAQLQNIETTHFTVENVAIQSDMAKDNVEIVIYNV
jgi:hypothetical protein